MPNVKSKRVGVCKVCGVQYFPEKKTSLYCSRSCSVHAITFHPSEDQISQALELYQGGMTWQEVEVCYWTTDNRLEN